MGRFDEILTGSYTEPRAGQVGVPMSKPRSLQEAQQWLRRLQDEDGNMPFAHLAYWAGFVLIATGLKALQRLFASLRKKLR